MEENLTVTLIRKKPSPFVVNYPYQVGNSPIPPTYRFAGTKGNVLNKLEIPFAVYEWLRDYTSTFTDGELFVEGKENIKEYVQDIDKSLKLEKAMPTENEIKAMISKGNHLSFKKSLEDSVKDLNDEQAEEIKKYIYRECINIGIDSNAKIKVLCDWAGYVYEDVKDNFINE